MSTIRPTGPGPSMLRINGQEITTRPSAPVEAPKPAGGAPATDKPVVGKGDTSQLQEEMYDAAHMASIRGEQAAAMIQGKKASQKKDIKKKDKKGEVRAETHKKVEGVFHEDDPANRQEEAFEVAAEFEEEVKSKDLTFKRKAAQVEVSAEIFRVDLDEGDGAVVMGESTKEIEVKPFSVDDLDPDREETAVGGRPKAPPKVEVMPEPMVREETVPNVQVSMSETNLRKVLGLNKK